MLRQQDSCRAARAKVSVVHLLQWADLSVRHFSPTFCHVVPSWRRPRMIIDISRFLKRSQNRCRRQERRRGLEWGVGVHSSCSADFSSSGVWGSAVDLTALTMPSFKLMGGVENVPPGGCNEAAAWAVRRLLDVWFLGPLPMQGWWQPFWRLWYASQRRSNTKKVGSPHLSNLEDMFRGGERWILIHLFRVGGGHCSGVFQLVYQVLFDRINETKRSKNGF